jgi:hypothetical protein
MPRPSCLLHPDSETQRRGYYGKHQEFIRWVCVPPNGEPPHYLRRDQKAELRQKLVGGPQHGSCDECEREWQPIDGMPNADYDKFVLREKARTLVRVSEGMSYKTAGAQVRRRMARRRHVLGSGSIDGRMVRDWVGQHAEIIAGEYLPSEWPEAIAVDSFDVRIRGWKPSGAVLKKGLGLYYVIGAAGYGPSFGQSGKLWHLAASARQNEQAYRDFFCSLAGRRNVHVVVCDGAPEVKSAAQWAFPNAEVYPCIWHLFHKLEDHLRRSGLWNRRRALFKAFQHYRFWTKDSWEQFEEILRRYLAADLSKLAPRQLKGIEGMGKWLRRNQFEIRYVLQSQHWPRDLKLLEEHLAQIQDNRLGDRRRSFRNLDRLNLLLKLFLLSLRGEADETEWARILRENHRAYRGRPPPRRVIDGRILKIENGKVIAP